MTPKPLVQIESPFAGGRNAGNITYARACLRDSLLRGEAPFASHLLYTQQGVLDDTDASQRALGIEAGLQWGRHASKTVVCTDLGVTPGMVMGIYRAEEEGRPVEWRSLYHPRKCGLCANDPYGTCVACAAEVGEMRLEKRRAWHARNKTRAPVWLAGADVFTEVACRTW